MVKFQILIFPKWEPKSLKGYFYRSEQGHIVRGEYAFWTVNAFLFEMVFSFVPTI